jgi:hypothetical protein
MRPLPSDERQVILLELNEVNFEYLQSYIDMGHLPHFAKILKQHPLIITTSEQRYEELEPWIQWVTAHTGLSFAEHGVFRLGDIVHHDIQQIWEFLEDHEISVGAISPINAANRTKNAAFFLPDPWTKTKVTGGKLLRQLSKAISQAVNDNANSHITGSSIFWILVGLARYAPWNNYPHYFSLIANVLKRKSWAKAQLLDELLVDVAIAEMNKTRPEFVSIFLNAAAHIQHHYIFNSRVYGGQRRNPEWLVSKTEDPVLDVYSQYDRIVGRIVRDLPNSRIMIATGLHQDAYTKEKYYWRLINPSQFLDLIGVDYLSILPRMSRDFLVECSTVESARIAEELLNQVQSTDGSPLFDVDNRGASLFVTLVFPDDVTRDTKITFSGKTYSDLHQQVAFVAIKNGMHNGEGYLIDTGSLSPSGLTVPLKLLPDRIASAFGLKWPLRPE